MEQDSVLDKSILVDTDYPSIVDDSSINAGLRAVELTQAMVRFPSITPDDAGCFDYVQNVLERLHFVIEEVTVNGVTKFNCQADFWSRQAFCFCWSY